MNTYRKALALILALTLSLSLASCSTIQSAIGSITGKEDPSVAGNMPAGNHDDEDVWTPSSSQSGQEHQENDSSVTWSMENGVLTVSGNGPMEDLPTYYGSPVRQWTSKEQQPWRKDDISASVTSVVIEPGVTTIATYAFCNFPNLKSISIANSVTIIGDMAFAHCDSLTDVTIPNSVTSALNCTFMGCTSLKTVTIGTGVEELHDICSNCPSMESVTILNGAARFSEILTHFDDELRERVIIYAPPGDMAEYFCKELKYNFVPLD